MKYFANFAAVLGVVVAQPISSIWTLEQISNALEYPHTDQSLIQYLEQALNKLMDSIFAGHDVNAIIVDFPEIAVKPTPMLPDIIPSPSANSGPLVQLIVNVNNQNEVAAPEIVPSPVQIAESPEYEDIIAGPVIVEKPEVIVNPVDVINPVPSPAVDGDFGVIVLTKFHKDIC